MTPTPESLSLFVVYMCAHIQPSSVCAYLSRICHSLKDAFPEVRAHQNSHLVTCTLAGCFKQATAPVHCKCALSFDDLQLMLNMYATSTAYNDKLFLTIVFTAFWALLRLGEMVVPDSIALQSLRKQSLRYLLSITDASFTFFLPTHKADWLYKGNKIMVLARTHNLNPIPIFSRYITAHNSMHSLKPFLWVREDGSPPTRSWFMMCFHHHFPKDMGRHSLQAGRAGWQSNCPHIGRYSR